jgi:hypothetical protein
VGYTVLERVLVPERHHQRAARTGFSRPFLSERPVTESDAPFLATNMSGNFLPTRMNRDGVARFGFTEILPEEENALLLALFQSLERLSTGQEWGNRCTSVQSGLQYVRDSGHDPRSVVVSDALLLKLCPSVSVEEAKECQSNRGYAAKVEDLQILLADGLPGALVFPVPSLAGCYVRVADYLGILLYRVSSIALVLTCEVDG